MHLEKVEIVHFIPGRVRLRAAELRGQSDLAMHVREKTSQIPGITQVDISTVTGSVLIAYDSKVLARPESLQIMREVMEELFPNLDIDQVLSWLAKAQH